MRNTRVARIIEDYVLVGVTTLRTKEEVEDFIKHLRRVWRRLEKERKKDG